MDPRQKKSARDTAVILVANSKGGVGKTTTTIQTAAALTELGRTSLIIDLDMTAGATKSLRAPTQGWSSSYELLTGVEPPEDIIIRGGEDEEVKLPRGIHLIPSSPKLAELDRFLIENPWVVHQDMLLEPIRKLRGEYDYVWLDSPPQVTRTTIPSLKAADFVVLSAMPEHLAVVALGDAVRSVQTAQRHAREDLVLLGIVLCSMPTPKTRLAQMLVRYVDENCVGPDGTPLRFDQTISRSVAVQEAVAAGQTLFEYAADHKCADEYRALARELEARIAAIRAMPAAGDAKVAPGQTAAVGEGSSSSEVTAHG